MFKIYFIEYDENGNEIRRGVHPGKEYKTCGRAWRFADTVYGDRNRYETYVSEREPWGEYYREFVCDVCKQLYSEQTSYLNYCLTGMSVDICDYRENAIFKTRKQLRESGYIRRRSRRSYNTCPECFNKITSFIDGITVKEDLND